MSTSDRAAERITATAKKKATSDRMVALEALAGAALVVAGVSVASSDIWMLSLGFHPAWLPVIILSSRYGPRGLFWSLTLVVGVMMLVDLAEGGRLGGLEQRLHGASDLLALVAATLVAWVAMMHEGRMGRLQSRLDSAIEVQVQAEATEQALHDNLGYLRGRLDRLELSLSVWRDLAGRLERGEHEDAADAALELCAIRTGADAGRVTLRDGASLVVIAGRGAWPTTVTRFRDKDKAISDKTVQAALMSKQVTTAPEDATDSDSLVAAPVLDEGSGVVIGVIALRGIANGPLRSADLHDLQLVAQWLAPALARGHADPIPARPTGRHRVPSVQITQRRIVQP